MINICGGTCFLTYALEIKVRSVFEMFFNEIRHTLGSVCHQRGFIAFFNVKAIALGAAGFLGILSIKLDSLAMYSIGMVISFVVAFTLSVIFVKRAQAKA